MKNNTWAKTLLYTYKYLERVAQAIDDLVEEHALHSFYYSSIENNDAERVSKKIISLIERKKRLINIKVLVDKCLESCNPKSASILIEKYMDNDRAEDIAMRNNLSMRTYFRRLADGEDSFSSLMTRFGFSDKKLCEYLKNENWIKEVYNGFDKTNKAELELELF